MTNILLILSDQLRFDALGFMNTFPRADAEYRPVGE